ncbi:endonuclease [Paracnuella aquatica]|nr:endonuclease [Paracnuella aquatica]
MVYLIHFQDKLHHAQHYLGFVETNLAQRIQLHLSNRGAKLIAAVNNQGIRWQVVRVWHKGDRNLERKLKNYKKSRCFCPICCNNQQRTNQ